MLNSAVILLTLFNCIDAAIHMANVLSPLSQKVVANISHARTRAPTPAPTPPPTVGIDGSCLCGNDIFDGSVKIPGSHTCSDRIKDGICTAVNNELDKDFARSACCSKPTRAPTSAPTLSVSRDSSCLCENDIFDGSAKIPGSHTCSDRIKDGICKVRDNERDRINARKYCCPTE